MKSKTKRIKRGQCSHKEDDLSQQQRANSSEPASDSSGAAAERFHGQSSPGEISRRPDLERAPQEARSPYDDDRERELNARMADQLRRVASVPGGFVFIDFSELVAAGKIDKVLGQQFGDLLSGLASLVWRSSQGEASARMQLAALDRLVYPEDYEFPPQKVRKIVDVEIRGALARGWRLVEIMSSLSAVVQPKHGAKSYPGNKRH